MRRSAVQIYQHADRRSTQARAAGEALIRGPSVRGHGERWAIGDHRGSAQQARDGPTATNCNCSLQHSMAAAATSGGRALAILLHAKVTVVTHVTADSKVVNCGRLRRAIRTISYIKKLGCVRSYAATPGGGNRGGTGEGGLWTCGRRDAARRMTVVPTARILYPEWLNFSSKG